MNKKNSVSDKINLALSAFIILAGIVCGFYFVSIADAQSALINVAITSAVFVMFGLILFFATRVGDGKPVKRFSLITLIALDLPTLYVVLATIFSVLPLHNFILENPVIFYMSAITLGYSIPYTFYSGFEIVAEVEETEEENQDEEVEFVPEDEDYDVEETEEFIDEDAVTEEEEEFIVEGIESENFDDSEVTEE